MKKTIEKTSLYEIEFALQNDSPERIKELIMEYKSVKSEKFFGMKAIFLLTVVVDYLIELRNKEKKDISLSVYQNCLTLDKIIEISESKNLYPLESLKAKHYLDQLPGYISGKSAYFQSNMTKDQHDKIKKVISLDK
ncbi:TPA: hypothetical protein NV714_005061 [Escherichia coli]|mgnify:CR=1 FL=1|nr:hypothetical protein [Escherichia coli]